MGYLEIAKRAIKEMEASNRAPAGATTYTTKTTKVPSMPPGVTLIRWEPKPAPVIISRLTVVHVVESDKDVAEYVRTTLAELASALHQQHDTPEYSARSNGAINVLVQPGAMAVRECLDRLEQCGVIVRVPGIGGGR